MERKRIILAGIIAALIAIIFILVLSNSASVRLKEQLDLGQKYMGDLDYEQAIAAYETAIDIDSRCVEAYLGLAEACEASKNGYLTYAYEILQKGYELTQNERIEVLINELGEKLEKNEQETADSIRESKVEEEDLTEKKESIEEETATGTILIKEFVEAPTIFGKPWKDVTIEEFCNYYGLSESKGWEEIKLDDNWRVQVNFGDSSSPWVVIVFGLDQYSINATFEINTFYDDYFFNKELISSGINFSYMEGYYEYLTKNNINSIEGFLTAWEVDKVSEEFMQTLKAMRLEESIGLESMDFQSDYGKVCLTLYGAGDDIRIGVDFENEDTWADNIVIIEDEESIHIAYYRIAFER